jgi:hypothetical protein
MYMTERSTAAATEKSLIFNDARTHTIINTQYSRCSANLLRKVDSERSYARTT